VSSKSSLLPSAASSNPSLHEALKEKLRLIGGQVHGNDDSEEEEEEEWEDLRETAQKKFRKVLKEGITDEFKVQSLNEYHELCSNKITKEEYKTIREIPFNAEKVTDEELEWATNGPGKSLFMDWSLIPREGSTPTRNELMEHGKEAKATFDRYQLTPTFRNQKKKKEEEKEKQNKEKGIEALKKDYDEVVNLLNDKSTPSGTQLTQYQMNLLTNYTANLTTSQQNGLIKIRSGRTVGEIRNFVSLQKAPPIKWVFQYKE
jgi:hypothetical protein